MGNSNSRFGKCWPSKISAMSTTTAKTVCDMRVCVAISSLLMCLSLLFLSPALFFVSLLLHCRYCCCFHFIFIVFCFVLFFISLYVCVIFGLELNWLDAILAIFDISNQILIVDWKKSRSQIIKLSTFF